MTSMSRLASLVAAGITTTACSDKTDQQAQEAVSALLDLLWEHTSACTV